VHAVLGIRGEPGRPGDPAKGVVWTSIIEHINESNWVDNWISVTDIDRTLLSTHPWTLGGGGSLQVLQSIEAASVVTARTHIGRAGFFGITGFDELALADRATFRRWGVHEEFTKVHVAGDEVRDWTISPSEDIWYPYNERHLLPPYEAGAAVFLWPHRTHLGARKTFSGETYTESGRPWWSWHQLPDDAGLHTWVIAWSQVATHGHFAIGRKPWAFNSTATIMRLQQNATEDLHSGIAALLNSSTGCFWLKQHSQDKPSNGVKRGYESEAWT